MLDEFDCHYSARGTVGPISSEIRIALIYNIDKLHYINIAYLPIRLLRYISNAANCEWRTVGHLHPPLLNLFNLRSVIKTHIIQHSCQSIANGLKIFDQLGPCDKINIGVIQSRSMCHEVDFYCHPMAVSKIIREIHLLDFGPWLRIPMLPCAVHKVMYLF